VTTLFHVTFGLIYVNLNLKIGSVSIKFRICHQPNKKITEHVSQVRTLRRNGVAQARLGFCSSGERARSPARVTAVTYNNKGGGEK
jgi:hypothetical protein